MKKVYVLFILSILACNEVTAQDVIDNMRTSPYRRNHKAARNGEGLRVFHGSQGGIEYTQPFEETLKFSVWDFRYNQQPERPDEYEISYRIKNMWGIAMGWNMNFMKFNNYNAIYFYIGMEMGFASADAMYNDVSHNLSKTYVRLPLSIGFRHGGEVSFDKAHRFSFSFGAGMAPAWHIEDFQGPQSLQYTKNLLTTMPFLWADIGHFIGTQAKLRITYYPTGLQPYTVDNTESYLSQVIYQSNISATGTGSLVKLSLIIMPFSGSWKSSLRW